MIGLGGNARHADRGYTTLSKYIRQGTTKAVVRVSLCNVPDKPYLEAWKPDYPDPEDCCDGGCRVCVYDVYDRKISLYEQKKEEMESFLLDFS